MFISKTSVAAQGPFRIHHIAHKTGWNHCFQSDWLAALKHLGFSVHQFLISHPGNKVALTRRQAYKISVVSTLWLIIKDFVWDLVARKQDTLRHNLISPKYQKKNTKNYFETVVSWLVCKTNSQTDVMMHSKQFLQNIRPVFFFLSYLNQTFERYCITVSTRKIKY